MKNSHPPSTDIIVVTYNAKSVLTRCLRSVIRHTRDLSYRLTVLDNASTDGTSDHLKRTFARECDLLQSRNNLGFSGGANLALRRTYRPWVVLLDDDAEVTPGWLLKLHALAQEHPKIGIVGGKVVFHDRRIFCAEYKIIPFGSAGFGELDRGQRDYTREVDALPGPCWLMPRSLIDRVGYFDERFFPSQYEDIDYCLRARLAGYKIFYHGKVKILHSNMYRSGPQGAVRANEAKFFKKWRKTLSCFPLSALGPDERLITRGARFFQKEKFCPVYPVAGKVARLNRWFSEALYRGIATMASGGNHKATRELRRAAAVCDTKFFTGNRDTVSLCCALSVYFARLGLKNESKRYAKRALDLVADIQKRFARKPRLTLGRHRSVLIALHGLRICVSSDDLDFFGVLKNFLPNYFKETQNPIFSIKNPASFEICFSNKIHDGWTEPILQDKRWSVGHSPEVGIYRMLDRKNHRIFVVMTRPKYFKDNWILHGSFLWPLEFLLRFKKASLVHGALLEKGGRGILVLGAKGAGKSTLSAACLERGYRYFSDEHPILELHAGRVRGKSFVSPIALPAISAGNFISLRKKMTWSTGRQKYLLDAPKVWPGCVGGVTPISRVIFPRFDLHGKFSVRRLKPNDFFKRLLQDEYLKVLLPYEQKNPEKSVPQRIAAHLSRTARGFTMTYGPRDIQRLPAIFEGL